MTYIDTVFDDGAEQERLQLAGIRIPAEDPTGGQPSSEDQEEVDLRGFQVVRREFFAHCMGTVHAPDEELKA